MSTKNHILGKRGTAMLLALLLVLPSVYAGTFTPKVYAVDVPAPNASDLAGAASEVIVCSLGGWVSSVVAGLLPWLSTPVTSAKVTAVDIPLTQTATGLGVGAAAAAPGAAAAAAAVNVPVTDVVGTSYLGIQATILAAIAENTLTGAMTGVEANTHQGNMSFKECVLDPLANLFKNLIIDAVTDSIVAWIKGGFDGSPTFVEDPSTFFRNVGENAVSAYLYESGLDEILCEPFSLDVILGISWDFYMPDMDPQYGRLSCGLDEIFPGFDVTVGLDGSGNPIRTAGYDAKQGYEAMFADGNLDFPGGGWDTFAQSLGGSNNALGASFEAQSAAAAFTAEQVGRESTLLDQGDGWFSPRCDIDSNPDTARVVCTPGEYVAEHVNEWSDGQLERLQLADEFAEIVNALLQLLIETVLSDGNNLLSESFRR